MQGWTRATSKDEKPIYTEEKIISIFNENTNQDSKPEQIDENMSNHLTIPTSFMRSDNIKGMFVQHHFLPKIENILPSFEQFAAAH